MNHLHIVSKLLGLVLLLIVTGCFSDSQEVTSTDPVDKSAPFSPEPTNGAVNQSTSLTLRWECEGAEYYDVYWGQGSPNLKIASGIKDKFYPRPSHAYNVDYYWSVTAHYSNGADPQTSPVWKYTTQSSSNNGPNTPLGYSLTAYRVKEYLPAYVNVLFQVQDTDGKGVPGLTSSNFTIYDDYEMLAFQEHTRPILDTPNDLKVYTVLMLDNSTSLSSEIGNIRNEAEIFINSLVNSGNPANYVAIYSFSADINKLTPLTPEFTNDLSEINNALNSYSLGAMSTDLYGAVVVGAEEMIDVVAADSIRQSFLVVFTDGKDTQDSTPYNQAKNAASNKKVYTLGFDGGGIPGLSYDPVVLEDLGSAGFFPVGDSQGLREAFAEISDDILDYSNSFYTLHYLSPREGPNNHIIRIEKSVNPIISFVQESYNSKNFFHPEGSNTNVYLVNTSNYDWYEPYNSTNFEPNKIYTGTHYFQAVTYLGQKFSTDYTISSPTPSVTIYVDPDDSSKFSVRGTLPYTIDVVDNTNLPGSSRRFIFEKN